MADVSFLWEIRSPEVPPSVGKLGDHSVFRCHGQLGAQEAERPDPMGESATGAERAHIHWGVPSCDGGGISSVIRWKSHAQFGRYPYPIRSAEWYDDASATISCNRRDAKTNEIKAGL